MLSQLEEEARKSGVENPGRCQRETNRRQTSLSKRTSGRRRRGAKDEKEVKETYLAREPNFVKRMECLRRPSPPTSASASRKTNPSRPSRGAFFFVFDDASTPFFSPGTTQSRNSERHGGRRVPPNSNGKTRGIPLELSRGYHLKQKNKEKEGKPRNSVNFALVISTIPSAL